MKTENPADIELADDIVQEQLHHRLDEMGACIQADALAYVGPISYGADAEIRTAIEDMVGGPPGPSARRQRLAVMLETTGGYAEVAEHIADTLRAHYDRVDFIVPSHAFSAGTILVMSGDAIHMDYYSLLGPIDPQVDKDGRWVPALGYLEYWKALLKKSAEGKLTTAELAFMLDKFDPGELHAFEQQRELSVALLKKWLVAYKFKNWHKTKSRGRKVTARMRAARATQIARKLQKTTLWHVHGRGLSKDVLEKEVNLVIDDFGQDRNLNDSIRKYHKLLTDYMRKIGAPAAVHSRKRFVPLS